MLQQPESGDHGHPGSSAYSSLLWGSSSTCGPQPTELLYATWDAPTCPPAGGQLAGETVARSLDEWLSDERL